MSMGNNDKYPIHTQGQNALHRRPSNAPSPCAHIARYCRIFWGWGVSTDITDTHHWQIP